MHLYDNIKPKNDGNETFYWTHGEMFMVWYYVKKTGQEMQHYPRYVKYACVSIYACV